MTREKLFRSREFPYHLTARGNNREPFFCDPQFAWKTLAGELLIQQSLHGLRVHAFVVMPNHFHLLATSPHRDVDEVMRDFLSASTRIINHRTGRSGRVFGGRYFWSLVSDSTYYAHVLKYVIRNPAKAELCEFVADYPFSTYSGLVGSIPLPVAITPPGRDLSEQISKDSGAIDAWLNKPHSKELNEAIKRGLRKEEFQISPDAKTRRKIDLAF